MSLQPASEVLSFSLATIQLAPAAPPPPLVESAGLLAEANDYLRISALQAGPPPPRASSFAASEPPPAPAGPPCDTSQSPIYCVYTVQEDDTLSGIAAKFGLADNEDVASWELLVHSNKPDIVSEDDLIQIGQKLRIPQANGVIHTVLTAQTLSEIAEIYDTNMDGILAVTVNGITDADALIIGQELIVPDPSRFFKPAPPPPPVQSGGLQPGAGSQQSTSGFIWPTTGPISSYYSAGHPLGIDIDLYAAPNAPIYAAASGIVTFAGGNPCCSYGFYVVVDHGNGFQTLYAHFSQLSVVTGQSVSQGELLGYAGSTGYATGNHLHFEVHIQGSVVNPLLYLP